GSSLPRATCLARACSLPPCAARASCTRRSSTSACMARALSANACERGLMREAITGMAASQHLYRHGHRFAAADAQRGHAALATGLAQRPQQRGVQARARGADGMTQRSGAAVDVDLFVG